FVERIVSAMPVWIRRQLNDVDRSYTRADKRLVIVATDAFFTIDKHLVVSERASGLPDDVLQPPRARRVAAQLEVLVTHHVEQQHRSRILQLVARAQLRNVMTAAVRIIRVLFVATFRPAFTKRLFSVEEHESIRHFWFFFAAAEHSTN